MEFRHPKYYKELRKRNKSDQAISTSDSTECSDKRAPGPGLKQQAASLTRKLYPVITSYKLKERE